MDYSALKSGIVQRGEEMFLFSGMHEEFGRWLNEKNPSKL